MKTKTIGIFATLLCLICCSAAWSGTSLPAFDPGTFPAAPDYGQKESWLVLPENPGEHPVDVFWVYPTVLMDDSGWIQDIADPAIKKDALVTVEQQAGVFKGQANIYAPLYRQANMAVLSLDQKDADKAMAVGQEDVGSAFEYYLKHLNQGRPFILAGHSQGSNQLIDMAVSKWGRTGAEKRLVAAYLIGWSITREDLEKNKALTMCRDRGQTNCFISYNSVAPGKQSKAPTIKPQAIVVNPISWKTDSVLAPAGDNLGSVFFLDDGARQTKPGFASAQVLDNGLAVVAGDPSLLEVPGASFPAGVYHAFDYALFFENLKANVRERIKAYEAAGKSN